MNPINKVRDDILEAFAKKHRLKLQTKGNCGFGRPCVGFLVGDNYVDYNPVRHPDYEYIDYLYSEEIADTAPKNAYHKHNCMAVLVQGGETEMYYSLALDELADWAMALEKLGVEVEPYNTGAVGIQAMVTGAVGHAFRLKPKVFDEVELQCVAVSDDGRTAIKFKTPDGKIHIKESPL